MVDDPDPEKSTSTEPGRSERVVAAPPLNERATPDERHIALKRVLGVTSGTTGARRSPA